MERRDTPKTPTAGAFAALAASGPHPDHVNELMLFGQFVGDWDVEATLIDRDGTAQHHRGEWLFAWALEGRAIQDVLISPPRAVRAGDTSRFEYGTTIRFYDASTGLWQIVYISPVARQVHTLVGGRVGDTISLDGPRPDGALQRWSFSDITADAFRWQGRISRDGGETWLLNEEMRVRRR